MAGKFARSTSAAPRSQVEQPSRHQMVATTTRRPCSAWHCWSAYLAAFVVALLLAPVLQGRWPESPLFNGLLLTSASTTVVFAFSFLADNSSVYDPYWVLAPPHPAFVWKAQAPGGFWSYEPRRDGVHGAAVGVGAALSRSRCRGRAGGAASCLPRARGLALRPDPGPWSFAALLAGLLGLAPPHYHLTPSLLVYCALCPLGRVVLQGSVGTSAVCMPSTASPRS